MLKQLKRYGGREGQGWFRTLTPQELTCGEYLGQVWCETIHGDARRVKITSVKTWKRQPHKLLIGLKYGMYEYTRFTEQDVAAGRLLVTADAPVAGGQQEELPLVA